MESIRSKFSTSAAVSALVLLGGYCNPALSASISLVNTPLYLTPPATPNLIMAIDDSGSMDYETTLATNDGAAWWRVNTAVGTCTAATGRSFAGCGSNGTSNIALAGRLNFNQNGENNPTDAIWEKFVSLFPNGCTTATNDNMRRTCAYNYWALPPIPKNAWARANAFNASYFDPQETYLPWINGGGYTFTNASTIAARFDPVFSGTVNTIDLTNDVASAFNVGTATACSGSSPAYNASWGFRILTGMVLPAGTCIRTSSGNWTLLAANTTVPSGAYTNGTDVNIRYFPATFYLTAAESAALPASYGYIGATVTGYEPDGVTVLKGYEIKPANFSTAAQYNAAIQNFANWFTYYRKRHLALRAGLGRAFDPVGGLRVAGFRINDYSNNVSMLNIDTPADKTTLFSNIYANWTGRAGTPNRNAVNNIVRNFQRTGVGAPIQYACQQNFGMLFTDGFSDGLNAGDGFDTVGNVDGSKGAPYADAVSNTMADGVMKAYTGPLIAPPTFPLGKVHPPLACSSGSPDPRLDCNPNLHMNFFAITLGTKGITYDPNAPVDPFATTPPTTPAWPSSTIIVDRNPLSVDDLWHATVNGRGKLFNADKPTDLSTQLSNVLNSISDLTHSSASSAAVNSGSISSTTRVYQARFDTQSWEGQLLAHTINADGSLGTLDWDAGTKLPGAASRHIVTTNSGGTAAGFNWTALDATRKTQLDANATLAQAKLNYLRGDATNEAPAGYGYRKRPTTKLGDIVNSSPVYVGKPTLGYRDSLESAPYSAFVTANNARRPIIYAGANDGMVHAFNGTTGIEEFAFIPSKAFPNLSLLTSPTYVHRYYVDGTAQAGDVYYSGSWHTMLVGGMNAGGQEIYALDITDPTVFPSVESSPSSLLRWEFTDANDADLGYTFSQPQIVRMHNGKWAAVFGNGYNNTAADGSASTTGYAVLYIVDIQNGSIMSKITTRVGSTTTPNGLATPALVDIDGDRIVDYAFAGDLYGNMWKFDLRDANAANWKVAFQDVAANPLPLYAAVDNVTPTPNKQPITERPVIIRGPTGAGMTVLFGTGKYLEASDNLLTPTLLQTFYGIYDQNTGADTDRVPGRSQLQQQSITNEITVDLDGAGPAPAVSVRATSDNPIAATKRGWFMDLISPVSGYQAEKSVANPLVRNGHLIFTTLLPSNDPCSEGGTSWLMELDALTGRRLTESPFDLNADGGFSSSDYVTLPDGSKVPASALKSTEGILPTPGVLADKEKEFKYTPGTSGEIQVTTENPGKTGNGRQSWRQVR